MGYRLFAIGCMPLQVTSIKGILRVYEVLKLSHELTLRVYKITSSFPNPEKYQLVSQMQRAAYSIPLNFSEGCGRGSDKDRFVQISLGSAHE